ncbi:MAG: acetyl-coenzyme A synthetase N-terminal domain-containing protein, partial [Sulfobacillus sp.]
MADDISSQEHDIEVHWQEEDYYEPPLSFVTQANLQDPDVYNRFSLENFPDCFVEYAELLDWYKPWDTVLDSSHPPFW